MIPRRPVHVLVACLLLAAAHGATAGPMALRDIAWNPGSKDCARDAPPPLEVHSIDAGTWVLRENPCVTRAAPFMYLLVGSTGALLIDTGDVRDATRVPLATAVLALLPQQPAPFPLRVAHTSLRASHVAGDAQFAGRPGVELLAATDASSAPGDATLDLGGRIIDVLPTPGPDATHVAFYDRSTALLFSGELLFPGRLQITDRAADRASAQRLVAFARDHPIGLVLGSHIELSKVGEIQAHSRYRPDERALPVTREDLMALPGLLADYNGYYTRRGDLRMQDPRYLLATWIAGGLLALAAIVFGARVGWRQWRAARAEERR